MMKQIQVVAAFALAVGSSVHAQQAVQWRVQDGGNGHWYAIYGGQMSMTPLEAARAGARAAGGHLITITSYAEGLFVNGLIGGYNQAVWWLGVGRSQSGQWQWDTGEPWSYTNFSGYPWCTWGNQGVIAGNMNANCWCTATDCAPPWHTAGDGVWVRGAIEWSADCNTDGIVDYGQCRDGFLPDDNGNNIPDCCEQSVQCPQDCNGNNIRDDVDLASGRAIDGDMDGVLDECGSASPLPRVRTMMVTRGADLCGAWDTNNIGAAYLWDMWVSRSGPDGPWINRPDSVSGTPLTLQAQLRQGVNELTIRYEPNGCGASLKTVSLWLTDGPNPTLSGVVGTPSAPYAGVVPGLVTNTSVTGAGVVEQTVGDWIVRLASFTWSSGSDVVGPVSLNPSGTPDIVATVVVEVDSVRPCVAADIFRDFNVNGADLGILLSQWGPSTALTVSDLNGDGVVDGSDLGRLLASWGPCP